MKKAVLTILILILTLAVLSSCSSAKTAMKYKSSEMSEAEYSYWFSTFKAKVADRYGAGVPADEFWDKETPDGVKYSAFFTDWINGQIKNILIASELFDEEGLELDSDLAEAIDSDIAEKIDFAGGEKFLEADLAEFGMTIDDLKEVYVREAKISVYHEKIASAGGDVEAYYKDNYRAVKMILIYTGVGLVKNSNGDQVYNNDGTAKVTTLDDFQRKQKQELVDKVISELKDGAKIDDCVSLYSEKDYSDRPHGFLISKRSASEFGEEFVDAVFSMAPGEVRAVEDTLMTFILCRVDLPGLDQLNESELEMLSGISDNMVDDRIEEIFSSLSGGVEVDQEILDKFDIKTARKNTYY